MAYIKIVNISNKELSIGGKLLGINDVVEFYLSDEAWSGKGGSVEEIELSNGVKKLIEGGYVKLEGSDYSVKSYKDFVVLATYDSPNKEGVDFLCNGTTANDDAVFKQAVEYMKANGLSKMILLAGHYGMCEAKVSDMDMFILEGYGAKIINNMWGGIYFRNCVSVKLYGVVAYNIRFDNISDVYVKDFSGAVTEWGYFNGTLVFSFVDRANIEDSKVYRITQAGDRGAKTLRVRDVSFPPETGIDGVFEDFIVDGLVFEDNGCWFYIENSKKLYVSNSKLPGFGDSYFVGDDIKIFNCKSDNTDSWPSSRNIWEFYLNPNALVTVSGCTLEHNHSADISDFIILSNSGDPNIKAVVYFSESILRLGHVGFGQKSVWKILIDVNQVGMVYDVQGFAGASFLELYKGSVKLVEGTDYSVEYLDNGLTVRVTFLQAFGFDWYEFVIESRSGMITNVFNVGAGVELHLGKNVYIGDYTNLWTGAGTVVID